VLAFFSFLGIEIVLSIIVVVVAAAGMSVLAWTWPKLIVWGNPLAHLVRFSSFFFWMVRLGSSSISVLFRCCQAANTHYLEFIGAGFWAYVPLKKK